MAIHHINCGTLCPRIIGRMVCHCLVIETNEGLVLVETGLGLADLTAATERFGRFWMMSSRPRLDAAETAVRQIESLGWSAADVRHIVVTHLDFDHAGGLPDFPRATVHVHARELEAATARATAQARARYVPEQFADRARWRTYSEAGERWFGFDSVRALADSDANILLIPLYGHTVGHCGVAVKDGDSWLLHCGDAYFHRNALTGQRVPIGLAAFELFSQTDGGARRRNGERLAALARDHGDEVFVFNAHDAAQFDRAVRRQAALAGRRNA